MHRYMFTSGSFINTKNNIKICLKQIAVLLQQKAFLYKIVSFHLIQVYFEDSFLESILAFSVIKNGIKKEKPFEIKACDGNSEYNRSIYFRHTCCPLTSTNVELVQRFTLGHRLKHFMMF